MIIMFMPHPWRIFGESRWVLGGLYSLRKKIMDDIVIEHTSCPIVMYHYTACLFSFGSCLMIDYSKQLYCRFGVKCCRMCQKHALNNNCKIVHFFVDEYNISNTR